MPDDNSKLMRLLTKDEEVFTFRATGETTVANLMYYVISEPFLEFDVLDEDGNEVSRIIPVEDITHLEVVGGFQDIFLENINAQSDGATIH